MYLSLGGMKRILRWLGTLFIFIVIASLAINIWLARAADKYVYTDIQELPHNTYAMVLGTVKFDDMGKEHEIYKERIQTAFLLYQSGKADSILVSSNNTRRYGYNAATMKADLIALGVPASKIIVDAYGLRTLDSILRCKKKFGISTVTIVSQKRHCERAIYLAQNKNLDVVAFPAPSGGAGKDLGTLFHEQVARFVMIADLLTGRQAATLK